MTGRQPHDPAEIEVVRDTYSTKLHRNTRIIPELRSSPLSFFGTPLVCSDHVLVKGKRLGDGRGVFEFVSFGTSDHFAKATCPSCPGVFIAFVLAGEAFEYIFDGISVLSLARPEYHTDKSHKSVRVHVAGFVPGTSATRTQGRAPALIVHVCAADERDGRCLVIRRDDPGGGGLSGIPVSPWIVHSNAHLRPGTAKRSVRGVSCRRSTRMQFASWRDHSRFS